MYVHEKTLPGKVNKFETSNALAQSTCHYQAFEDGGSNGCGGADVPW